jgi:phage tail sheath protein FI
MEDTTTRTNLVVPPSVAVLGAFALNDAIAFPWFAPAGFTRGALTTTLETTVKFNRANLDVLYEADINPIATFPGQPPAVFGQKTLQQAQSALDRVNVRRLLIDLRRKVRAVANTFVFEPNRASTLARFQSQVQPILQTVQAQQGVERFKVVIDTTTTTQADVENNTVRGKIFLQPTRSLEFVSLDFVVTNTGAVV